MPCRRCDLPVRSSRPPLRHGTGSKPSAFLDTGLFVDLLGHVHEVNKADMEIHYRSVPHFQTHIAVSARLRGVPSSKDEINEKLKAYSSKRWTSTSFIA